MARRRLEKIGFNQRLQYARELRQLEQIQLADMTDISASAISSYESGKRTPDLGNTEALCRALNISSDFLLGLTEFPEFRTSDETIFSSIALLNADQIKLLHTMIHEMAAQNVSARTWREQRASKLELAS